MSGSPRKQLPFFPGAMEPGSGWSSVSGSGEESSYAWSNSLSSSEGSSDFSDSDYSSLSDDSSYDDDDSFTVDEPASKSKPKQSSSIPQPPPMMQEGLDLSMLAKLKSDLLKVGQAIVQSDVGKIEAERAQTLASINWLSGHVPNAVLEHLGHETRKILQDGENGSNSDGSNGGLVSAVKQEDDMSQVSELSDQYMEDMGQRTSMEDTPMAAMPQGPAPGYGDLATLSEEKMNSFLPSGYSTMAPPGQGLLAGVDELTPIDMTGDDQNVNSFLPVLEPSSTNQSSGIERYGDIAAASGSVAGRSRMNFSGAGSVASGRARKRVSGSASVVSRGSRGSRSKNRFASGNGSVASGRSRGRRASIAIGDTQSVLSSSNHSGGRRRKTKGSVDDDSGSVVSSSNRSFSSRKSKKRGMKGLFKRIYNRSSRTPTAKKNPAVRIDVADAIINPMDDDFEATPMSPTAKQETKPIPAKATTESFAEEKKESVSEEKIATGGPLLEIQRPKEKSLPRSQLYLCSLLFVDISGFTKLSTMLDPESLSKAINSYFQLIVNEVMDGKGDLLKFAGDAVFIEWKADDNQTLESCVEQAANCAAKIISVCSDYTVLENGANGGTACVVSNQAAKVDSLNVHCGIGAGHMVGVHVGDNELRREYILLGQPIAQATVATDFASLGEVAASPEAIQLLKRTCTLDETLTKHTGKNPCVIAKRGISKFVPKQRLGVHQHRVLNSTSRGVTSHVEGLEVEALRKYRQKMSLYVHPVVVDNDLAATKNTAKIKRTAQERHREEAELRNVYVMFVNPAIETKITKNEKANKALYKQLNDIMNLSSREIERFTGHLRQFIVDDKGLVLIITFGLRGTTMPNMVAERALPATISIHNALQMELGLQCKIGATIGEAYCGVVGGVKRHEYAVLGPSVNLAARLMASKMNPGILVDNRVRMMANRSYGFNALTPVVAKGYKDPVPIFEPLSPLERDWGKILPNFVGRKDEIMHIMQLARDMVLANNVAAKMVMIEGKSGMGKTATVAHAIEHIRKLMGANKHRLIITKNVGKESDSLVPFGVFRYIIRDVLKNFRASNDDKSYVSGTSCYTSLQQSIGWESLSGRSISQSTANLSTTAQSDVLKNLCRELDMPSSFIDHALSHLLGLKQEAKSKAKPPPPKIMISFLARAFKVCTQDARLVVLALDDLHHADDMSWKVIQQIFETAPNVLVIGTTYPTDNCKLNIDKAFFEELKTKHAGKRFVSQSMKPLTKEETTLMIMKTLGLQKKEVKADLLAGVTIQSGGMPHFVNEILEQVKRQMAIDEDFEISDMTYESFGDLVLQRVDDFDLNTRNMLNIGAVLGLSFTLDEVIAVQMKTSEGQEAAVRSATQDGLREAVKEGIVECKSIPSDEEEGRTVTKYSFYHAVWRTALLNLMLDGRKRDLHRTIAEVLEDKGKGTDEYMFQTRLFSHWVQSGNFVKASELALALGKHFEERLGLPAQSIKLYNDALSLRRENEDVSIGVAGFTEKVLNALDSEDLSYVIRLQVALGNALAMAQQIADSVTAYQDSLRIVQGSKAGSQIEDRSILFPVFTGLSTALKRGQIIQDPECKYEQAMLRRYVQETRIFGDPIYQIHAITLQADMYARIGDFESAIDVHRQIEPIYDVEEHSVRLCEKYSSDLGAQNFAASALWLLQLDEMDDSLGTCWFVIDELLPKIDKRNVHSLFMIMYPIIWVMKENGLSAEALDCFEEFVCEAYTNHFGEGRSTFFLPLYDPVLMLLDLSSGLEIEDEVLEEYLDWALDVDNLTFGMLLNAKTGELGRTADSISAEICYLLAGMVEEEEEQLTLLENGIQVAEEDLEFAQEQNMILAEYCATNLLANLENGDLGDDDEEEEVEEE